MSGSRPEALRALRAEVQPALRQAGFQGSAPRWYRERGEALQVVDVTVEPEGDTYAVQLGVWWHFIPPISPLRVGGGRPRAHACPVREALSAVAGLPPRPWAGAPAQAAAAIREALLAHGLPWLDRLSRLEALAAFLADTDDPRPGTLRHRFYGCFVLARLGQAREAMAAAAGLPPDLADRVRAYVAELGGFPG